MMRTSFLLSIACCWFQTSHGQVEQALLPSDEHFVLGDVGEDPDPQMNAYEALNKALGGDSIRSCSGHPCLGWVEDQHANGSLKHRGFYDAGQLTVYKNYWPDGTLEREFRSVDAVRSILRTYHSNGQLRSETRFVDGASVQYEDRYVDATDRQEKGRIHPEGVPSWRCLTIRRSCPIRPIAHGYPTHRHLDLLRYGWERGQV
jgi:hypothetical protein